MDIMRVRISSGGPSFMRIFTFQTQEVYDTLISQGVVLVDPKKSQFLSDPDWASFIPPYDWMREQMRQRLPDYQGGYPWWGLAEPTAEELHCWFGYGHMLELDVPDELVLISHYDAWYCVLNHWNCALTTEEDDAFEAKWGARNTDESRAAVQKTWQRILDYPTLSKTTIWGESYRQACFEKLRLQDLRSVRVIARVDDNSC